MGRKAIIDMRNYIRLMYVEKFPTKDICKFFGVTTSGLVCFRKRNKLPARGWSKPPWLGKKRSKETIEKISQSMIGKTIGNKNGLWKGGKYISNGYRMILVSGMGYVPEHRLIMERTLKRKLKSCEIVHHINGNKIDNRFENLRIFDRSSHAKHHFPKGSLFGIHIN